MISVDAWDVIMTWGGYGLAVVLATLATYWTVMTVLGGLDYLFDFRKTKFWQIEFWDKAREIGTNWSVFVAFLIIIYAVLHFSGFIAYQESLK